MVITIKSGDEKEKIQLILKKLSKNSSLGKRMIKKEILKHTFCKVKLHPSKSPTEIQKELRDEWN